MKKFIAIIATVVLVAIIYTLSSDKENPQEYIDNVIKERQEKDRFMSKNPESPFKMFGDTTVQLNYYPVDLKYNLMARIEMIEDRQYLTLGSSDGQSIRYLKYAYAHFKLDDKPLSLLILKDPKHPNGGLFTAFADQTSTDETYGAGRYLDLDFKRAKRISLDFNKAYNPYCAYNGIYSCPFPPQENMLPVKIEAGEKSYH